MRAEVNPTSLKARGYITFPGGANLSGNLSLSNPFGTNPEGTVSVFTSFKGQNLGVEGGRNSFSIYYGNRDLSLTLSPLPEPSFLVQTGGQGRRFSFGVSPSRISLNLYAPPFLFNAYGSTTSPEIRLAYQGREWGIRYQIETGLTATTTSKASNALPYVKGVIEVPGGDWSVKTSVRLSESGLSGSLDLYRALDDLVGFPLDARAGLRLTSQGPSSWLLLQGRREDFEGFLSLSYDQHLKVQAGGSYRFSIRPEPPSGTVEGQTLPGTLVQAGERQTVADEKGQFALRLSPGTHSLRVLPPPGVIALPEEREVTVRVGEKTLVEIYPKRAVKVRADCPKGAGSIRLENPERWIRVPCAEEALIQEGTYTIKPLPAPGYRLEGALAQEIALKEDTILPIGFAPLPTESVSPPRLLALKTYSLDGESPPAFAPGEVLLIQAEWAEEVLLEKEGQQIAKGVRVSEGWFALFLPLDAPKAGYQVRAIGKEAVGFAEIRIDPRRPLASLKVEKTPAGEAVVQVRLRTIAQALALILPEDRKVPLQEKEPLWYEAHIPTPFIPQAVEVIVLTNEGERRIKPEISDH